jgi:hypothetical protein
MFKDQGEEKEQVQGQGLSPMPALRTLARIFPEIRYVPSVLQTDGLER